MSIKASNAQGSMIYPVRITRRAVNMANPRPGLRAEVFDAPNALAINQARLDHLASLGLPLAGRRVIDVGCGVGHLARFFVQQSCDVTCVDGRPENIDRLRELYPDLASQARVIDVNREPLTACGRFDVVFCYGLLYHVEDPVRVLRHLVEVCDGLLLLETVICDSDVPMVRCVDEYPSWNQALGGIGSRPSPAFIALALNRIGIPHVYAAATPPDHDDFRFAWKNNLDCERDGHNLRCIFVASRHPIDAPTLVPLLSDPQPKP
jgi:SAM-dependent methyltransferase